MGIPDALDWNDGARVGTRGLVRLRIQAALVVIGDSVPLQHTFRLGRPDGRWSICEILYAVQSARIQKKTADT